MEGNIREGCYAMIGEDVYYSRPEVSNSDLLQVEKYFMPPGRVFDIENAYRFGNLIDAMITEPHRCDHYRHRVDGVQFTADEWKLAYSMKNSYDRDPFCQSIDKMAEGQKVMSGWMEFEYADIRFSLEVRCKWDRWMEALKHGADIKSTVATTQKQFEDSLNYFNYDQQRAFYMDIARMLGYPCDKDVLIGISKVNQKIFKVPIVRDGEFYLRGKEKYTSAAFRWWYLFANFM